MQLLDGHDRLAANTVPLETDPAPTWALRLCCMSHWFAHEQLEEWSDPTRKTIVVKTINTVITTG